MRMYAMRVWAMFLMAVLVAACSPVDVCNANNSS